MLASSIILFVAETILAIVVPITAQNETSSIIFLIISIVFTICAIGGVVGSVKRIKAADQRGKNIVALVFSIANIVSGVALLIMCIIFTAAL